VPNLNFRTPTIDHNARFYHNRINVFHVQFP